MDINSVKLDVTEILNNPDVWINHGRKALENNCNHRTKDIIDGLKEKERDNNIVYSGWCDKCEVSEDSAIPMMNYGYPMRGSIDEEKILKIVQKTNCTVIENDETGEWFLILTGGGMNLSQDIALAFYYAYGWIPTDIIMNMSLQPALSISKKDCKMIFKQARKDLRGEISTMNEKIKKLKASIQEIDSDLKSTYKKSVRK